MAVIVVNTASASVQEMAARKATCVCRLCQGSVPSSHAVCFYNPGSVRQRLPGRIADMLDVSVDSNDGFPEHVCKRCKRRLERLEKAAEDLESFRAQVRASYASLRFKRSELKRSKDTSSIDASPDTVRVRPPSKKLLTARHLDFDNCKFIDTL